MTERTRTQIHADINVYGGHQEGENIFGTSPWWDPHTQGPDAIDKLCGLIQRRIDDGFDGIHFRPLMGVYLGNDPPFCCFAAMPPRFRALLVRRLHGFRRRYPAFEFWTYLGGTVPDRVTMLQRQHAAPYTPRNRRQAAVARRELKHHAGWATGVAFDAAVFHPEAFLHLDRLCASVFKLKAACEMAPLPTQHDTALHSRIRAGSYMWTKIKTVNWFTDPATGWPQHLKDNGGILRSRKHFIYCATPSQADFAVSVGATPICAFETAADWRKEHN